MNKSEIVGKILAMLLFVEVFVSVIFVPIQVPNVFQEPDSNLELSSEFPLEILLAAIILITIIVLILNHYRVFTRIKEVTEENDEK
ncbi:MAG: hypothetical protein ACFFAS_18570 [Promethearchaeota archaeon]